MKNFILALGFLVLSSSSVAAPKTIFNSGFNAASYADILMDSSEWRGEKIGNLKIKVGVQVARYESISIGLGFQKTGFYDASYDLSGAPGSTKLDYRGPLLEVHFIPSSNYSFSISGSGASGFYFHSEPTDSTDTFAGCNGVCNIGVEKSRLEIKELSLLGSYKLSQSVYVMFGLSQRETSGKVSLELRDGSGKNGVYHDAPSNNWHEKSTGILIGIRGTTF